MCLFPKSIPNPKKDRMPDDDMFIKVSCGRCLECLKQKSLEWSFRIMDECSLHSQNCFITLTYNDEHLPEFGSVSRREVQLFMKSLRQVLPCKVRFFACGEYGKKLLRPHYHIIIFGWFPDDAWFFQRDSKGVELFRSPLVERVWKKGFSSVGMVSLDTALYCAKYMNKFQFDIKHSISDNLYPPFIQMSNRPGIGFDCVYRSDLASDRLYRDGKSVKIPRYYLKVMERDGVYLDDFKLMRQAQGEFVARCIDLNQKRIRYYEKFLGVRYIDKIHRPR